MRHLVSCLVAALAVLTLASCGKDVPTERFECLCHATSLATDNTRSYVLCEPDSSWARSDATTQCEKDFGGVSPCDCTCTHAGSCSVGDDAGPASGADR